MTDGQVEQTCGTDRQMGGTDQSKKYALSMSTRTVLPQLGTQVCWELQPKDKVGSHESDKCNERLEAYGYYAR